MQSFSVTSEPWQEVLDRLPPELDLDALALSSGALKRRREVGDGATLLRLVMARGPGGLSLNQTAAWAAMQGLAQLSDPAVKYRLDRAVPFLKAWRGSKPGYTRSQVTAHCSLVETDRRRLSSWPFPTCSEDCPG